MDRDALREQIDDDVFCPACGYNLRALVSDRCPECALDVAFIKTADSQIPWVHRERVGRIRAYLVTVWMVVFRTQRFCLEMSRPVDERQARGFRRATLLLAYAPFVGFTAALAALRRDAFDAVVHFGGYGFLVVVHAALLAAMVSMTAVPYYVIRHPEVELTRQLRAATLSLYCGAPLCVMGLAVGLAIAGLAASHLYNRNWDLLLYTAAVGVFVVAPVILLFDVQRIIRWMLGGSATALPINFRLFLFWLLCGVLTLGALPVAAAYVIIVASGAL